MTQLGSKFAFCTVLKRYNLNIYINNFLRQALVWLINSYLTVCNLKSTFYFIETFKSNSIYNYFVNIAKIICY